MKIEINRNDIVLLNTIKEGWAKLGLGLDAAESMLGFMGRVQSEYSREHEKQLKEKYTPKKKAKK